MILLIALFACSDSTEVSNGDCASLSDLMKKDTCYHTQIVSTPAAQIDTVIQIGGQMVDPMVRGAAIAEWIKQHNNEINQQKGQELCALLDGRDRSYCMRRLSSPHLRR